MPGNAANPSPCLASALTGRSSANRHMLIEGKQTGLRQDPRLAHATQHLAQPSGAAKARSSAATLPVTQP